MFVRTDLHGDSSWRCECIRVSPPPRLCTRLSGVFAVFRVACMSRL